MHDHIEREVLLYIPSILCNETAFVEMLNRSNISFDPLQHQMTLPMMVSLHYFTGAANREIPVWRSLSDELTFILVAPNGIGRSWNADQCCGYAADNKLNDTAFIQSVIHKVQQSFSELFPFLTLYRASENDRDDGYLWITGFSNGAFMADKLAWQSAVGDFPEIIAMAASSGYIYDNSRYIDGHQIHRNVPVFFNHGLKDKLVNSTGCCHEQTTGCCCGIAQRSNFCSSIHQEFEQWLRWNQCDDGIHFDDIAVHQLTERNAPVSCAEATPTKHGCAESTKLCLYGSGGHDLLRTRVAMRFLVESLCTKVGGEMEQNIDLLSCRCPNESSFGGLFCISPKKSLGMELVGTNEHDHSERHSFLRYAVHCGKRFLILVFVMTIGFGAWSLLSAKRRAVKRGYSQITTNVAEDF